MELEPLTKESAQTTAQMLVSPPVPLTPRHRPRGKIHRLPFKIRDDLNRLMDDGLTYKEIISALGEPGSKLTEMDLSRWYASGHQDWIKNQIWLEETRTRLDMAVDVIQENSGPNVHLANLHVAATQLIESLVRAGEKLLAENPDAYVAIINSVSRLGREALNYHKYSEACAQAREEIAKLKDTSRKLSDEETHAIVDHLDRILGFK